MWGWGTPKNSSIKRVEQPLAPKCPKRRRDQQDQTHLLSEQGSGVVKESVLPCSKLSDKDRGAGEIQPHGHSLPNTESEDSRYTGQWASVKRKDANLRGVHICKK